MHCITLIAPNSHLHGIKQGKCENGKTPHSLENKGPRHTMGQAAEDLFAGTRPLACPQLVLAGRCGPEQVKQSSDKHANPAHSPTINATSACAAAQGCKIWWSVSRSAARLAMRVITPGGGCVGQRSVCWATEQRSLVRWFLKGLQAKPQHLCGEFSSWARNIRTFCAVLPCILGLRAF